MTKKELENIIEIGWENRLEIEKYAPAIEETIFLLDKGELRVAEKNKEEWIVNQWLKKAILLYFSIRKMEVIKSEKFEYYDKIPVKTGFKELGVRIVPPATARYGSYLAKYVILMPSYVNIGAYVDENTMVDTWVTVGSCAQIGKNVHLSGGVGIGGVLEPLQSNPTIIEDNCFIGSRSIIVEGVHIKKEAVLAANVVITASTKIIDVTNSEPIEHKGYIPERSVVIPGSIQKQFNAGNYNVNCALIIGKRKESTDKKTSLNNVLRDYNLDI